MVPEIRRYGRRASDGPIAASLDEQAFPLQRVSYEGVRGRRKPTAVRGEHMADFHHILFPYDFSPQGRDIARFVGALARRAGARITLFSVVPPSFEPVPAGMDVLPGLRVDPEPFRRALQAQLDRAFAAEFVGVATDRVADVGDPAIRLVDYARHHDIDLIMMPTHGLGLYRRMLIGSTTAKVLHDATCPVWTAAHVETQTASELPQRTLCAVDGTAATASLARWAADFAQAVGATLKLFHVVGPITDWPSLERERRLQEEVRQEAHASILKMVKDAGVDAPVDTAVGHIVPTVTAEALRERADLVIVGRGSVPEPFGRLRTHAFGIIQRSPCPVVSV